MKSLISSMLVLVGFGSRVGNPEVISSPVGLVPRNARALSEARLHESVKELG